MKKIAQQMVLPENMVLTLLNVKSILDKENIDSVVVGGIAVGAHSEPRTTKGIDFAIKYTDLPKLQSLFDLSPLSLTVREGFTTKIEGTDIDFLILEQNEYFLLKNQIKYLDTIDVASCINMIWLKLTSGKRTKDMSDIIQIFKKLTDQQIVDGRKFILNLIKNKELDYLMEDIIEDYDSLSEIAKLENKKDKTAGSKFVKLIANKLSAKNNL